MKKILFASVLFVLPIVSNCQIKRKQISAQTTVKKPIKKAYIFNDKPIVIEDMIEMLKQTITKDDEILAIKGYFLLSKDIDEEFSQQTKYAFITKKINPDKMVQIQTWLGNELKLTYIQYVTSNQKEFSSFRMYPVTNNFERLDKGEVGFTADYSNKNIDIMYHTFEANGITFYSTTVYPTLSRMLMEVVKKALRESTIK